MNEEEQYTVQDLQDNLNYLDNTKNLIKNAIITKGQSVSANDTFRSFVDKILAIETSKDYNNIPIWYSKFDAAIGTTFRPNDEIQVLCENTPSAITSAFTRIDDYDVVRTAPMIGDVLINETTGFEDPDNPGHYNKRYITFGIITNIEVGDTLSVYTYLIRDGISRADYAELIGVNANDIREGVNILGVTGTLEEGIDTSDATATANDILSPETAYVNGFKILGNIITNKENIGSTYSLINYSGVSNKAVFANNTKYLLKYNTSTSKIILCDLLNNELDSMNYSMSVGEFSTIVLGCVDLDGDTCYGLVCGNSAQQALAIKIQNNHIISSNSINIVLNNYSGGGSKVLGASNTNPKLFSTEYRANSSGDKELGIFILNDNLTIKEYKTIGLGWSDFSGEVFFKDNSNYYVTYNYHGNTSTININVYKIIYNIDGSLKRLVNISTPASGITAYNNDMSLCINGSTLYQIIKNNETNTVSYNSIATVSYNGTVIDITDDLLLTYSGSNIYIYKINNDYTLTLNNSFSLSASYNSKCTNKSSDNSFNFYNNNSMDFVKLTLFDYKIKSMIRNNVSFYNTDDANAINSNILANKIAYNSTGKIAGTMPNNGALSYTPTNSQQIIPAGYTSGGTIAAVEMTNTEYNNAISIADDILGVSE